MSELSIDHISLEASEVEEEFQQEVQDHEIAPWLNERTKSIKNPNVRFHCEIIDFYQYISPKKEDHMLRISAVDKIKKIIEDGISDCSLIPFGSFVTQLYLPNSDVDMVLMSKVHNKQTLLTKASKIVKKSPDVFTNVEILKNARVPIIKFTEAETGVDFDICFNEEGGLLNIDEFMQAFEIHPEIKYLMFIFKVVLRQRRLNNSFTGGIGSFLLFCMVLAFLREFKRRKINEGGINALKNCTLTDYLLKFLYFYGIEFDYQRREILMTNGGKIVDKDRPSFNFSLMSPQNPGHNIGNQVFKFKDVFSMFKNRHNLITNTSFIPGDSILRQLINPSNRRFKDFFVN
jgi:non-canonical poly(A) RNA polymerase PAPD5/7